MLHLRKLLFKIVNYSVMIMSYWTKLFVIWGKLWSGHFASAYLGGSNKLRASLEFLYGSDWKRDKEKDIKVDKNYTKL